MVHDCGPEWHLDGVMAWHQGPEDPDAIHVKKSPKLSLSDLKFSALASQVTRNRQVTPDPEQNFF